MKYSAKHYAVNQAADCLIVGIFEEKKLSQSAVEINKISDNYLLHLVESGELRVFFPFLG